MRQQVKLIAAFATVYLVWGSTYLAIKLAVTTFPPFSMMGSRFLIAGAVLYLIGRRSHQPLRWRDLVAPTVLALTLIVFGTGLVGWVEQFIPSGLTALLVSISPFFLVLLDAMRSQGSRPGRLGLAGLAVGLLGTIMLIGPGASPERSVTGPLRCCSSLPCPGASAPSMPAIPRCRFRRARRPLCRC